MVLLSILAISRVTSTPLGSPLQFGIAAGHYLGYAIVTTILGIAAIYGSRHASERVWAIVLVIVGIIGFTVVESLS